MQILLVTQAVGATLDDADLVVESFDEAGRDFVLGAKVRAVRPGAVETEAQEAFLRGWPIAAGLL